MDKSQIFPSPCTWHACLSTCSYGFTLNFSWSAVIGLKYRLTFKMFYCNLMYICTYFKNVPWWTRILIKMHNGEPYNYIPNRKLQKTMEFRWHSHLISAVYFVHSQLLSYQQSAKKGKVRWKLETKTTILLIHTGLFLVPVAELCRPWTDFACMRLYVVNANIVVCLSSTAHAFFFILGGWHGCPPQRWECRRVYRVTGFSDYCISVSNQSLQLNCVCKTYAFPIWCCCDGI